MPIRMDIGRVWVGYAHTHILCYLTHTEAIIFDTHMGTVHMDIAYMDSAHMDYYQWISMSLYIFYPILITISKE